MSKYFTPKFQVDSLCCGRNDIVELLHQKLSMLICESGRPGERMIPLRLLADKLGVAPQTVRKAYLLLEADGLIYRPQNKRVWQLSGQVSAPPCIGVILPATFVHYFQPGTMRGECHFRMFSGLVDEASRRGYSIMPINLPPVDANATEIATSLNQFQRKFCGLIHLGDRGYPVDPPLQAVFQCEKLVQLAFNCEITYPHIGAVTFDSQLAVNLFVQHLTDLGHRHFGFVRQILPEKIDSQIRYTMVQQEEIRQLFRAAGVKEENLTFIDLELNGRQNNLQHLSKIFSNPDPPTGLFCRNDEIANFLIQRLKSLGYLIPEDFSVVGFNNSLCSEISDPPLTTISNPLHDLGSKLAAQLDLYLKQGVNDKNRLVRGTPQLVLRQSTGPCNLTLHY